MRSRLRGTILETLAAIAVAACILGPSVAGAAESSERLLVKFNPGASQRAAVSLLGSLHAQQVGVVRDLGVKVITVPAGTTTAALHSFRANALVSFAERDSVLKPQEMLPNDPYFLNSGSWNLGGGAWGWYATHTTQAWDITEGNPNVVIAILDTGLKAGGLDDFDGQVSSTWNVLNGTSDTTTSAGNHGTYVAGVAGLALGNGAGNAGYCPKCRLMIVQVGTDSGAYLSDIANGLTWAADHGARVANMSWAGSTDSTTLQNAINYAHSKGLVMTAAAGNSNCNCVSYPAADQNVLGVAGVADSVGDKQGDSNYGSWVALAAPEGDMTAWPSINGAPGYSAVGGTSVAAPAVAAIAGLLFSYNPSLSNTQVEEALEQSAAPVKFTVAHGRVDALAALQYVGGSDPQPSSAPVQTAPPQLYYEVNGWTAVAPLAGAPQVGQVIVRGIGGWTGSAGLSLSGLQWQRCDSSGANCVYLTNQSTYTVQSADVGSTLKLCFTIANGVGSVPVSVLTQVVGGATAVSAPTNTAAPAISGTAQAGQALTTSTGSWSGGPTGYAYQWLRCDSSGANCVAVPGAASSSYAVQTADVGNTLEVKVIASNSAGSASATSGPSAVVVSAPAAATSQTTAFSSSLTSRNPSRSFTVSVGAGTADAQLAFSKCSTLSLSLSNGARASGPSVVTLSQTLAAGTYTYTVSGGKCSFTITVVAPSP